MDRNEAHDALASADATATRLRERRARPRTALIVLAGAATTALTALYGLAVQPSLPYAVPVLLLLPLFGLALYTATRPVLARRHRAYYAVTTAVGAGLYTVTVTVGSACFSGEPLWWWPGAVLCAAPFLVIAVLDRRAAGRAGEGAR
ncbi:hypothetical protein [Kitasatospora sp. NPDC093806]|uniref:hypothetical protein n=1 Tax=Kitasatospora sp. NPDC093806 TaxID=3155075 RepID=UPI00343BE12A